MPLSFFVIPGTIAAGWVIAVPSIIFTIHTKKTITRIGIRQVVVHHGEHALLHLAAVPGVDDDLLAGGDVEGHAGLGVQTQLLVVLDLG